MTNSPVISVIGLVTRPGVMSKVMVLPLQASAIAWRRLPGPLLALVVTTGLLKQAKSKVEAEALSFSVLGSLVAETVTALLINGKSEFGTAPDGTWPTNVKVWTVLPATLARLHEIVPPEPTEGVVHDQPGAGLRDTNVI